MKAFAFPVKLIMQTDVDDHFNPGLDWRVIFGTAVRQSAAFKLACIYLFFEYVRPQSIWPTIDILPYAQLSVVLGLLFLPGELAKIERTKSLFNVWLIVYSLIVILSSVLAYRPLVALNSLNVYLSWAIIYFLIVNAVTTRSRWYIFLLLFLLCSFKMSQHGFRSWASRGFSAADWGVVGAPGFFHNSGEFGIQMCIFLPLSYVFAQNLWGDVGRFGKLFLIIMPLTAVGSIIASNSRGAVIGGVLAMMWVLLPKGRRFRGFLVLAIIVGIGYTVMPQRSLDRYSSAGTDSTSISRLEYWENGIDIMLEHPVIGVGFNNWLPYYQKVYGSQGQRVQLSHNILVQAGAELGFTGLFVFLVMFTLCFRINASTRDASIRIGDDFSKNMTVGLNASMIGFFVSGQFVTVLYYPYFWIGAAMAVALNGAVKRAEIDFVSQRLR